MELKTINNIETNQLMELLETGGPVKISLFIPVQQEPDKRDENRIRLKNMTKEAQEVLLRINAQDQDSQQLLSPIERLINGGGFMDLSQPGLAVFLSEKFNRFYQIPYSPEQGIMVGKNFYIKPLLPLYYQKDFYVLVLSQQDVRLLYADQYSVERVNLDHMPQSLDEALQWDDPEKQLQWHSQTSRMRGDGREAMFHGHGTTTKENHKENLLRYFQLLDQGLEKILANENKPLILSGVDYLLPIYRQASQYSHIIDTELTGNMEHMSDRQIRQKAYSIIEDAFQNERNDSIERFHNFAARDLASADLQSVISAAHQGRIETLFVAANEKIWGEYNDQLGKITRTSQAQPGSVDLLNLAAIYTIKNNGKVIVEERDSLPTDESISAIYRY